jgi:hypothetical protein
MIYRKTTVLGLIAALCLSIGACTATGYRGGAAGGAIGGVTGALLDRSNPWRGGAIGLALGSIAGASLTEISARGAREAADANRPVEYRTDNGRAIYRAEPLGYDPATRCRRVHERVWQDGNVVQEQIREICEEPTTVGVPTARTPMGATAYPPAAPYPAGPQTGAQGGYTYPTAQPPSYAPPTAAPGAR